MVQDAEGCSEGYDSVVADGRGGRDGGELWVGGGVEGVGYVGRVGCRVMDDVPAFLVRCRADGSEEGVETGGHGGYGVLGLSSDGIGRRSRSGYLVTSVL